MNIDTLAWAHWALFGVIHLPGWLCASSSSAPIPSVTRQRRWVLLGSGRKWWKATQLLFSSKDGMARFSGCLLLSTCNIDRSMGICVINKQSTHSRCSSYVWFSHFSTRGDFERAEGQRYPRQRFARPVGGATCLGQLWAWRWTDQEGVDCLMKIGVWIPDRLGFPLFSFVSFGFHCVGNSDWFLGVGLVSENNAMKPFVDFVSHACHFLFFSLSLKLIASCVNTHTHQFPSSFWWWKMRTM